jgi:molybdopterin-binding protein
MNDTNLKLFDVVALLKEIPERKLLRGQVGTIVEQYTATDFEVEFADKNGVTIDLVTLPASELMLLHYEMEYAG